MGRDAQRDDRAGDEDRHHDDDQRSRQNAAATEAALTGIQNPLRSTTRTGDLLRASGAGRRQVVRHPPSVGAADYAML
ncbi:hypothetical protein C5B96_13465 [Subtercola sp. Z020]|nr:hypothetical protein C5B96_13465 [Subtercola sp. Z020]